MEKKQQCLLVARKFAEKVAEKLKIVFKFSVMLAEYAVEKAYKRIGKGDKK